MYNGVNIEACLKRGVKRAFAERVCADEFAAVWKMIRG
jgi:hypothetical protein